ncbi:MAG: hypothetical protein Q8O42_09625 [Acidobacteriota bacterium]|nr:hypothetical protein [Acidobacteriota bacterium]
MKAVEVPMSELAKGLTITVTVKGIRGYRVRFWFGSRLVRLAARILQCNVSIEGRES